MAVTPKGFFKEKKKFVTIEEISNCQFVQPSENCDADSQILFKERGFNAKSLCHVVDDLSILTMVEAGFGVCILPKMLVECFNVKVDVYPVEPYNYRLIGVSCYDPSRSVPAVQKMYQLILDKYKQI